MCSPPVQVVIVDDSSDEDDLERIFGLMSALHTAGVSNVQPLLYQVLGSGQQVEAMLHHSLHTAGTMIIFGGKDDKYSLYLAKRFLKLKRQEHTDKPRRLLVVSGTGEAEKQVHPFLRRAADFHLKIDGSQKYRDVYYLLTNSPTREHFAFSAQQSGQKAADYEKKLLAIERRIAAGDFDKGKKLCEELKQWNYWNSHLHFLTLMCSQRVRTEQELIDTGAFHTDSAEYTRILLTASEEKKGYYLNLARKSEEAAKRRQEEAAAAEERRRQEEEQRKAEEKRRKDARFVRLLVAGFVALVLCIAAPQIYKYVQPIFSTNSDYAEAMALYESGDYQEASYIFKRLGDHEDSAAMYEQCMTQVRRNTYELALRNGEDHENRENAIINLLDLLEYYPEGQEYLDKWYQEGETYFLQGQYRMAQKLLRGYGEDDPLNVELRRLAQNAGLISISDTGDFLAVTEEAQLLTNGCEHLGIRETEAWSVSLSDSGASAGLIRTDGTACLYGAAAEKFDVSGWTDMRVIQITDSQVVGLQWDGTLRCARKGILARDVKVFDINDGEVIAVRQDGAVFCTNGKLQTMLADCADAAYAAVALPYDNQCTAYIINSANVLYVYSYSPEFGESISEASEGSKKAAAVITDSDETGVLYINGDVKPRSQSKKAFDSYGSAYIADFSDLMHLRIISGGSGYGLNTADSEARALGSIISQLENIGFPY